MPKISRHSYDIAVAAVRRDLTSGVSVLKVYQPWDKRSPSNSVPLDKWSQKFLSTWTNGPQPIWSPYFWIPTACPPGQTKYSRAHLSMGTEFFGTICQWGLNWLGTLCPEGPIN